MPWPPVFEYLSLLVLADDLCELLDEWVNAVAFYVLVMHPWHLEHKGELAQHVSLLDVVSQGALHQLLQAVHLHAKDLLAVVQLFGRVVLQLLVFVPFHVQLRQTLHLVVGNVVLDPLVELLDLLFADDDFTMVLGAKLLVEAHFLLHQAAQYVNLMKSGSRRLTI